MSGLVRALAWSAVLLIGFGSSVYYVHRSGDDGTVEHHEEEAEARFLTPIPYAEMQAVEVVLEGNLHRFERDDEGRWLYHGHDHESGAPGEHTHDADPEAAERIDQALAMFSRARIDRTIGRSDADPADYGLDRPEMFVFVYRGGDVRPTWRIQVGDLAPNDLSRYVRLPEALAIALIPDDHIANLTDLVDWAAAKPVPADRS